MSYYMICHVNLSVHILVYWHAPPPNLRTTERLIRGLSHKRLLRETLKNTVRTSKVAAVGEVVVVVVVVVVIVAVVVVVVVTVVAIMIVK